jgi:type IV pilus assembly protein PilM
LFWGRSKTLVGLDVGTSAVKAVEISLSGSEPVVTGFARVELGQGLGPAEAIAECARLGRFRARRAAAGLSGPSTVVRHLAMQAMTDDELKAAVRFDSDKHLPFDVDECRLDCQSLGAADEEGKQRLVLLAAARNALVDERVAQIRALGLAPEAIDLDLLALSNAFELCAPLDAEGEGGAVALVDVGCTRTAIHVLSGLRSRFSREIPLGGADMTLAVGRRFELDGPAAEARKRDEQHEADVREAALPVVEDLANELALSLEYVEHHEGLEVREVLLSGGGALCPGVRELLEELVRKPVRWWSPLEGLRVDEARVDVQELGRWTPTLAVAVGLASRVRAA